MCVEKMSASSGLLAFGLAFGQVDLRSWDVVGDFLS